MSLPSSTPQSPPDGSSPGAVAGDQRGSIYLPGPDRRWRCGHCGNLTRFDVVRSSTVREYWHLTMAGEPEISETEVVSQDVLSVTCRWCGSGDRIEIVARPTGEDGVTEAGLGGTP